MQSSPAPSSHRRSVHDYTFHSQRNSFLGYVDLLGTTYSSPTLATGFGAHIAQPLLREAYEAKAGVDGKGPLLTAEEAEALMDECMKVLFYRDARSINKVSRLFCSFTDGGPRSVFPFR